jgi:hypothetical protein
LLSLIIFFFSSSFSIIYATSASKENSICCSVAAKGGAGQVTRPPREQISRGGKGDGKMNILYEKIDFLLSTNFNFLFRPIKAN